MIFQNEKNYISNYWHIQATFLETSECKHEIVFTYWELQSGIVDIDYSNLIKSDNHLYLQQMKNYIRQIITLIYCVYGKHFYK